MLVARYSLGRDFMSARFILYLSLVLVFPSFAGGLPVIAGFGDSITCDSCGDGSYLRLLGDYLGYDPIIDDNGVSADTTGSVLSRLDVWLDSNTADVLVLLTGTPDVYEVGNNSWVLGNTVGNIEAMISMVLAESIPLILVAPPPVGDPCLNPPSPLTCGDMNGRLASLAAELASPPPGSGDFQFLDLYAAFTADPDWQSDPNSFYYLRRRPPRAIPGRRSDRESPRTDDRASPHPRAIHGDPARLRAPGSRPSPAAKGGLARRVGPQTNRRLSGVSRVRQSDPRQIPSGEPGCRRCEPVDTARTAIRPLNALKMRRIRATRPRPGPDGSPLPHFQENRDRASGCEVVHTSRPARWVTSWQTERPAGAAATRRNEK